MEKPITIKKMEFEKSLAEVVNQSGLPPFILRPIMQEALTQVTQLEAQQLQNDISEYQKSLEEEESESEVADE